MCRNYALHVNVIDHDDRLRQNNEQVQKEFGGELAMKTILVLLSVVFGVSIAAYADTYQWVDDKGVVNFTDNPQNVPKKYLKKVKVIKSEESRQGSEADPASVPLPAPTVQTGPPAGPGLYGGHDESWWRSRYARLRGEIKALQDGLPAKREELTQLRRTLVVQTYARNREAYQAKLDEVQRDEARIGELTGQLSDLDAEATRAGVPFPWRQ